MNYEEQRQAHNKGKHTLDYEYISEGETIIPPTTFKVSPSGISDFLDHTAQYYAENLLGAEKSFQGSTSSYLGTALHATAEVYIKKGTLSEETRNSIYSYIAINASETVNPEEIHLHLTPMWRALKSHIDSNPVAITECHVGFTVSPGVVLFGSIDAIRIIGESQLQDDGVSKYTSIEQLRGKHVEIVDWKSSGALTAPTKISRKYFFQLQAYAYILQAEYGIIVDSINNTYITRNAVGRLNSKGKPMKDYPSTVSSVSLPMESYDMIAGLTNLIADSVTMFVNNPELRGVLSQDGRNSNNTATLPFILGETAVVEI